jgi:hypothetical protein
MVLLLGRCSLSALLLWWEDAQQHRAFSLNEFLSCHSGVVGVREWVSFINLCLGFVFAWAGFDRSRWVLYGTRCCCLTHFRELHSTNVVLHGALFTRLSLFGPCPARDDPRRRRGICSNHMSTAENLCLVSVLHRSVNSIIVFHNISRVCTIGK